MDFVRYALAVLLVIAMPPAFAYWFLLHPFVNFWRRLGSKATFSLLTVFMIGSMVALFFVRDHLVGRDLGTNWWSVGVAIVFYLLAIWFYRQRKNLLKFRILAGGPELDRSGRGGELITTGIYSRTRNPRYLEVGLGITAYALVANHVGAYLVTAAAILAVYPLVLLEERELRDRFGEDYEHYLATVPRFLPRFRPADSVDDRGRSGT